MDKDGSGEVDFIEFVLAVWNYCSFSHASLVRFAFDLYDLDGSGEIEHAEVLRCVREVWGSDWEESTSAQKIVTKLDAIMQTTSSGKLSVQKFQEFALRHPMLLFPAFQLQTEMQKKVLGEKFWLRVAKKRGSVNPCDLSWMNVQALSKISKQTSSKFLQALEDDLGEQITNHLSTKPGGALGNARRPQSFARSVRGFLTTSSYRKSSLDAADGVVSRTSVVPVDADSTGSDTPPPTAKTKRTRKQTNVFQRTRTSNSTSPPVYRGSAQLVVEDLDSPIRGQRAPSVKPGGGDK